MQDQIIELLRGIEERTPRKCDYRCSHASPINGISTSIHSRDCNDRHVPLVRAEQARAVERMIDAAIQEARLPWGQPHLAALRAVAPKEITK